MVVANICGSDLVRGDVISIDQPMIEGEIFTRQLSLDRVGIIYEMKDTTVERNFGGPLLDIALL